MPSQVQRGLAMGRGRQKAKNTKVARELKYFSPNTDLTALQAELATSSSNEPDYEDKWADLYPDEQEETTTDNTDGGSDSSN
jgi:hypothetical protein